jgi:hypothetical protein
LPRLHEPSERGVTLLFELRPSFRRIGQSGTYVLGLLEPPLKLRLSNLERRQLVDARRELAPCRLRRLELKPRGIALGRERLEPAAELRPHVREVLALPL